MNIDIRNALKLAQECEELAKYLRSAADAAAAGGVNLPYWIAKIKTYTTPQGQTGCIGYPLIDAVDEAEVERLTGLPIPESVQHVGDGLTLGVLPQSILDNRSVRVSLT